MMKRENDSSFGGPCANCSAVIIGSGVVRPVQSGSGVLSWLADWSPTGNRYVVSTNRTGPYTIEDVSAQDSFSRRLAVAGPDAVLSYPRWSPDGSRVAYTEFSTSGARMMVTNVAGGRPTPFGPAIANMVSRRGRPTASG